MLKSVKVSTITPTYYVARIDRIDSNHISISGENFSSNNLYTSSSDPLHYPFRLYKDSDGLYVLKTFDGNYCVASDTSYGGEKYILQLCSGSATEKFQFSN
jgi:hypothetical protein